jgi:putative ABC transport system permease protein
VTTVVALGSITTGLKASSTALAQVGAADFMVAQNGAADLSFSTLAEQDVAAVAGVEGVARAWGVLLHISQVGAAPYFVTYGVEPDDLPLLGLRLTQGRLPATPGEIALGSTASADLGVSLGETITVEGARLEVVGTYAADSQWQEGGGYALLSDVQALARMPGLVTMIYVSVADGADAAVVAERVGAASETFATIASADEYAQVDQGMKMLDAANLAISMLAVLIGAIGVMNTMIMSVFERTREIGVLRAVGWTGARVVRMILGESVLLCLVAAVLGIAAGVLVSRAVMLVPAIGTFLTPAYPPEIFVRGVVIAVGVAVIGALYPVVRAVRLSPMEALRHE